MVEGEAGAPEAVGAGRALLPGLVHLGQDLLHGGCSKALGGRAEGEGRLAHAPRGSASGRRGQGGCLFFPRLLSPRLPGAFSTSQGLGCRPWRKRKGPFVATIGLGSRQHVHLPGRRQLGQRTPGRPRPNGHQQTGLGRQGWLGRQGSGFGLDRGFGPRVTYQKGRAG